MQHKSATNHMELYDAQNEMANDVADILRGFFF